ncbi:MAG TPA: hypothetical protein VJG49_00640 [Candidatus Nanoarchaeia archaeon]|nr:hypothetical protein [Candidatus Nanoarchaeia archaeon]
MDKKGNLFGELGKVVLAVLFILLIISIFISGSLFDIAGIFRGQINRTGSDSDSDGAYDFDDNCPCTYGTIENDLNPGCPEGYDDAEVASARALYNSDTGCGELIFDDDGDGVQNIDDRCRNTAPGETNLGASEETRGCSPEQTPDPEIEQVEERFRFINYRSIEISGDGTDQDGTIRAACRGWIGQDCSSADCDGEFNLEELDQMCWIMATELDQSSNDCGQAKVSESEIISLGNYGRLTVDLANNYFSIPAEPDPQDLFTWNWKSRPEYGSLVCSNGFWVGCKPNAEGRNITVGGTAYYCRNSEWVTS